MADEPRQPPSEERGSEPSSAARRRQRRDGSRQVANVGLALDLGMRLGISVILGLVAGLLLDGWLHTSPLLTLVGVILGIAAAMYTIWDVARDAMRK